MNGQVASDSDNKIVDIQHVFIIGSKSIGQYGGYETFVDRLIEEHENDSSLKYHIACKANGDGSMDETKLDGLSNIKIGKDGKIREFTYKNAHVFKIPCPNIGPAVAIYYDCVAMLYAIHYCEKYKISHPIFYVLTCRIGLFIGGLVKKVKEIGGRYYLNPDGHEWKRAKWSELVRKYWKWSEKKMIGLADLVICDSLTIEKYIKESYNHPNTTYIAYGADVVKSCIDNDAPKFVEWLDKHNLKAHDYYLAVGRFVPENNYETMIREFMKSKSKKDFVLITNVNKKFLDVLEQKLGWKSDARIKFVGTVYDKELLAKIRENAYGYFHGHEVGGTNPSLLEALGSTNLNLLLDVGFNREVGEDSALYWSKREGDLAGLIDKVDVMSEDQFIEFGLKAKKRIREVYSWEYIGSEYKRVWNLQT